jgi:hypothetical protein
MGAAQADLALQCRQHFLEQHLVLCCMGVDLLQLVHCHALLLLLLFRSCALHVKLTHEQQQLLLLLLLRQCDRCWLWL